MKRRLAILVVLIMMLTAFAVPVAADSDCIYTQGYWKNHEEVWSDSDCPAIGEVNTQDEWLVVLNTPPKGDPWLILAHQYIAAYLNELDSSSIDNAADILSDYGPGQIPNGFEKAQALYLANLLDDFNNNGY